jgi:catechol 2,3-dioxygenase-like lactoylglutathione lyase family enzyme
VWHDVPRPSATGRRGRVASGHKGRGYIGLLAASALLVLAASIDATELPIVGVDSVNLTVSDLERSRAFYTEVLDFAVESELEVDGPAWRGLRGVPSPVRVVRLRLGDERIELSHYPRTRGRPAPADTRSNDAWFQHIAIVVADMDRAAARLSAHGVTAISTAPQRLPDWNPNAAGIRAYYFRDPDGHPLELIWFPPGKGDARWQAPSGRLFRGIDHTAIAVADTDASLAYYRDRLGLRVAGASENHGAEQDALNGIAGSRVRITGLRAARGPGIEFLEYLAPGDGRPYPADARANDLVWWSTRLMAADDLHGDVADPPADDLGFDRGITVRDPDGHALEIVEP